MIVWLNGALVEASEARISPFDHGLLTGDGVFESVRVYGGRPFAWTRHYRRLSQSATGLGLAVPPPDVLLRAVEAAITANGLSEARVRLTVTGGPSLLGSDRGDAGQTLLVAATDLVPFPPTCEVVTVPWPRNERGALAGLKTISYGENVRALAYAKERGAGEALFANTVGDLCEGTGSNVFLVAGGVVRTPPLASGCLDGVTRQLVLEVAPDAGVAVSQDPLPVAALADADEVFLTSTTREVQMVTAVDGRAVPSAPGPVAELLLTAFRRRRDADPDP